MTFAEIRIIGNRIRNKPKGINNRVGLLTDKLAIIITGNDKGRISRGSKEEEFKPKVKVEHRSASNEILTITKNDIRNNSGTDDRDILKSREAIGIAKAVTSISVIQNAKYFARRINSKGTPKIKSSSKIPLR